jgi:hypothetical protein
MRPKEIAVEVLRIRVEVLTVQIREIEREDRLSFVPPPTIIDVLLTQFEAKSTAA